MTIKKTKTGYRWVDSNLCDHNFKSFCRSLRKKCYGDLFVSAIYRGNIVTVWGDTSIVHIQYLR